MAEYIGREALLEKARELAQNFSSSCLATPHIIKAIENAPKADVVEVVRCKDCKHKLVPHDCALWYGFCDGNHYFIGKDDEFFCSYGKRKEGAEVCF